MSESERVQERTGAIASDVNGAPMTPRGVAHRGGVGSASIDALRARFGDAIVRADVMWGETTVVVPGARVHDVIQWLHDEPTEGFDYLVDVTAVEFRDAARDIEVVWHLRALSRRKFLRVKVELSKRAPLEVPSVIDIYTGADWLERECYDMFGIRFNGHPDLRRLLLWDSYQEGHPLRKDFPLRGRFSRAEQLKQALAMNPEARYTMSELTIAEAFDTLPEEMKRRLSSEREARHGAEGGE